MITTDTAPDRPTDPSASRGSKEALLISESIWNTVLNAGLQQNYLIFRRPGTLALVNERSSSNSTDTDNRTE